MISSQRFWVRLPQRGIVILFITLALLPGTLPACLPKNQRRITHSLGSSTQHVDVLWVKQETFTKVTSDDNRTIYAMPISRDTLRAINAVDGSTVWTIRLPLERGGGARGLLTNQKTVFVITSIFVDAYEKTTGELKWSTRLGDGHVAVIAQLDSDTLRIYYGEELIELDPKTGEMLTTMPRGNTTWVSGNVILQTAASKELVALDRPSGEVLWINDRMFYIDEGREPIDVGNEELLVGFSTGICVLDLQTGEYRWCRPEIDIAKMTIDHQSRLGFGLRDDLVLLTIDLQTGDVLGETRFLSSKPIDEQIGFLSSITVSDGVVIVSFSDSGQTFGLEFKDPK